MLLEAGDTTPDAGDDVVITAWLENNTGSSVEISGYQTDLDCAAKGGTRGSIDALTDAGGQDCTGYEQETTCSFMCEGADVCVVGVLDCDPGVDCLDPVTGAVLSSGTGLCEDTGTCLTLPGVDQDDGDFMLSCAISTLSMPDHSCSGDDEVNVNAGNLDGGSCTLADTEKMYLGTFIYHVHNSAEGAFTLSPETTSVAIDDDTVELRLTLSGVTLTVP